MRSQLSFLGFFFVYIRLALAVSPSARWGGECVYLEQNIYCFAGSGYSFNEGMKGIGSLNDFYYLDVAESFTVSSSGSAWVPINTTGSFQAGPNFLFTMVAHSESNTIVVDGGVGAMSNSQLNDPTIAYDVKANSWHRIDGSGGLSSYLGTMVSGSDKKLYSWGGVSDQGSGNDGEDYPRNMRILDYAGNRWDSVMLPSSYSPRVFHSATLGNDKQTIYFMGGQIAIQYTTDNGTISYRLQDALLDTVLTFNTKTSLWARKTASGAIPTPRVLHTAAQKPNTNEIILYGGTYTNVTRGVVPDFCVRLDTTSMIWTSVNLSASAGAGPRFAHSAVFPYNSHAMFVLFGIDTNFQERLDFQVLDTNTWAWTDSYIGPGRISNSTNDTSEPEGSGGLSGGAIAGIVVGVVVGVALILGAVWFLFRRKQNKKTVNNEEGTGADSQVDDMPPPPPQYVETQLLTSATSQKPDLQTNSTTTTISIGPNWSPGPDAYYTPRLSLQPVKPDGD